MSERGSGLTIIAIIIAIGGVLMAKLQCPYCKGENTSVYSTRQYPDKINRFRKCNDCNQNFKTVETIPSSWSTETAIKKIKNIVDKF